MESNELHRQVGQLEGRVEANEQNIKAVTIEHARMEDLIDKVRDRVPPWIVWAMTAMGSILGSALTMLVNIKH